MQLITFDAGSGPRPGVLNAGTVYDAADLLGEPVASLPALLGQGPAALDRIRQALSIASGGTPRSAVRLLRPVAGTKFIGVGLNYRDHAEEQGAKVPANPILFAKFDNSQIGPEDDIRYPSITEQLDYEAELGVVIGLPGRDIPLADALQHVAGYTVVNDVTARDVQLADRQWVRGKTPDAITPVGPAVVTPDEVGDAGSLRIALRVNGEVLQDSSTSNLIFGVAELIAFISKDFTLEPGDVIATGTPAGVGFVREPAVFLERGDVVEVEIENVGLISNRVS